MKILSKNRIVTMLSALVIIVGFLGINHANAKQECIRV
jgi:hypothetical protein